MLKFALVGAKTGLGKNGMYLASCVLAGVFSPNNTLKTIGSILCSLTRTLAYLRRKHRNECTSLVSCNRHPGEDYIEIRNLSLQMHMGKLFECKKYCKENVCMWWVPLCLV